jgi:hypothetical protein
VSDAATGVGPGHQINGPVNGAHAAVMADIASSWKSKVPTPLSGFNWIVFREGEWFSAQCMERDMATQARTYEGLQREIERMVAFHRVYAERNGTEPFAGLGPAPDCFWQLAGLK